MNKLSIDYIIQHYNEINSLGRYSGALLHELERMNLAVRPVPVDDAPLPPVLTKLMKKRGIDIAAFLRTYPFTTPALRGDLVHLTQRTHATLLLRKPARPVVITVHDIIHYQHRHDPQMHIYRHAVQRWVDGISVRALRRADGILASSEYTRQALITELKLDPDRVHHVPLGVDQTRFRRIQVPDAFYQRYGLARDLRYILHVSTEEARKDFASLLHAFARIAPDYPDLRLLKIGRPLYPEVRARHIALTKDLKIDRRVQFIDDVSDDDLVAFYNIGAAMSLPSLSEGFGFPVLEAMACGCPVICSTGGSLPEVAGDAALFFQPRDIDALVNNFHRLLRDPALSGTLIERGLRHAATFTWACTAQKTVEVYRKAALRFNAERTRSSFAVSR